MKIRLKILACTFIAFLGFYCPFTLHAVKIRAMVEGNVFMQSGDTLQTNGSVMLAIPQGEKPLYVMSDPYTARQSIRETIDPEMTDSVVMWSRTSPGRPHTLHYLIGHGWCWILERGKYVTIYCFAPKGYHISGNGGMRAIGKTSIIVVINGKEHMFVKPEKMADNKFRQRLTRLVADDPALVRIILNSACRRDKTLRMLSLYSPVSTNQ